MIGVYAVSPVLFVFIEMSPTVVAFVAALAGALFLSTKRLSFAEGTKSLAVALGALSCFIFSSVLWSDDKTRSLVATRDVFSYSIAAILLFQCILALTDAQRDRLTKSSLTGLLIGTLCVMGRELYFAFCTEDPRFVGNIFTLHKITVYGAFFAVILLAQSKPLWKGIAAIFAVLTLLYGQSTGVDVAIIIVALIFAIPAKYRQCAFVVFLAVYLFLALIAPFVVSPLFALLEARGWLAFHPGTFAARLDLWKMISPHIADRPILGHGANTMRNAAGVVVNPTYYLLVDLPSAHNIVFDLWYELGVLGIAVYGLLLAAIMRTIGRLKGPCHFMAGSCLIVAVVELSVDHRIWLSWVLGALVFTASICILNCRSVAQPGTDKRTKGGAAVSVKR
ncbi:hypothetical protein MesoLj113c_55820 [Mesorhizobium sp. 113-3-9]|nr:hypothetical protein MesoLj113c_55820 [Mesorhizobium sp. 113-3-9]